jgi:hypothetical protein
VYAVWQKETPRGAKTFTSKTHESLSLPGAKVS